MGLSNLLHDHSMMMFVGRPHAIKSGELLHSGVVGVVVKVVCDRRLRSGNAVRFEISHLSKQRGGKRQC